MTQEQCKLCGESLDGCFCKHYEEMAQDEIVFDTEIQESYALRMLLSALNPNGGNA